MKLNLTVVLCGLLILVSFLAAGYAISERFNQTTERRAQQARVNRELKRVSRENRAALRDILCLAVNTVRQNKDLSGERRSEALLFYSRALAVIDVKRCPSLPKT